MTYEERINRILMMFGGTQEEQARLVKVLKDAMASSTYPPSVLGHCEFLINYGLDVFKGMEKYMKW